MKITFLLDLLGSKFSEGNLFTEFHPMVNQKDTKLAINAVLEYQNKFLLNQNEADIVPMKLETISEITGLSIHQISRSLKGKYFFLKGRKIFIKYLFNGSKLKDEEIVFSKFHILEQIKEILNVEDPTYKMTDSELTSKLNTIGIPIKIRTTNKYRNQLDYRVLQQEEKISLRE